MHELSIAMSIVEMAEEEADNRGARVNAVHLKLGVLAGVVKDALLSSYEMACEGTGLQGSRLVIEEIPVVVYCPGCLDSIERWLQSSGLFVPNVRAPCPKCSTGGNFKSSLWRYRNESATATPPRRSKKERSQAERHSGSRAPRNNSTMPEYTW